MKHRLSLVAAVVIAGATAACSGGSAQPAAPMPSPALTEVGPGPAASDAEVTLKVVSFNVLYGAGHDRRFDQHVGERFKDRDRMPELIAFLHEANPDILAVQEAAGWDTGEPPFAAQIAEELGMTYVLAPDEWELHIVLFSKYPIVAADYVSRHQGFNGVALRATVVLESETSLNVIAVHLNSMSRDTRACQVEALLDMAQRLEGRTLFLGDMNFRSSAPLADVLRQSGWQLVAFQEAWTIDQIWLDTSGGPASTTTWWSRFEMPAGISDHLPIGAEITFEAPRTAAQRDLSPVAEPSPLDYACLLPP